MGARLAAVFFFVSTLFFAKTSFGQAWSEEPRGFVAVSKPCKKVLPTKAAIARPLTTVAGRGGSGNAPPALSVLERQNRRLAERIAALESRVDELEESQSHHTFGIGLAMSFSSVGDGRIYGIESNLRYFFGCYYLGDGGCLGMRALLEVWRVKWHWLGLGVFINQNGPLTVRDIPRRWDLMLSSGVDVRIWKGLEVGVEAFWLFPNPASPGENARRRAEESFEENQTIDVQDAFRAFTNAYARAAGTPYIRIGARWEF